MAEQAEPSSPRVLDRDGVLSVLGYKGEVKQFTPMRYLPEDSHLCYKCGKKVYPVERVDVGALYHRSCFKCRVCNIQLSLRNFQRGVDVNTNTKEVFCNTHVPKHHAALADNEAVAIKAALQAQRAANTRREHVGAGEYGQGALEFEHLKRDRGERREERQSRKVRRSSTLRSFQDDQNSDEDFERYGVFSAQSALEKVQAQEEDDLYAQMAEERRAQMQVLQHFVQGEQRKTVQELVYWFQKRGSSQHDISEGLKKVEFYYSRQMEERVKLMEKRLMAEEQAAVARMTEKHAHEMIALIAEKENMAECDMRRHQEKLRSQLDAHDVASAKIQGNVKDKQEQIQSHLEEQIQQKLDPDGSTVATGADRSTTPSSQAGSHLNSRGAQGHAGAGQGQHGAGQGSDPETAGGSSSHLFNQVELVSSVAEGSLSKMAEVHDAHVTPSNHTGPSNQVEYWSGEQPVVAGASGAFRPVSPVLPPETVRLKDSHFLPQHMRGEVEGGQGHDSSRDQSCDYSSEFSQTDDDDIGTEGSYSLDDIETSLQHAQLEDDTARGRNERGQPFIQLQQPGQRATPDAEPTTSNPGEDTANTAQSGGPAIILARPEEGGVPMRDKKKKKRRDEDKPESAAQKRRRERREQKKQVYQEMTKPLEIDSEEEDNAVNERLLLTEVAQPRVVPPRDTKSKLYTDPAVFQQFDDRALREAQKEHTSYTDLVRKLSTNCKNELQKVRAIFIWITAKDLDSLDFEEEVDPDSPLGLLRGIKHGAESYHNLFKRLCSYAGLHCEIIEGHSKGSGYKPGASLRHDTFRNQWTAVWVKRAWRFINCNWGARHVKGPREERMTYKVDEFYFLTDPHEHIYQHYPADPKWQLLSNPVTMDEFIRLPVVKSPFFNNHLAFAKNYSSVVPVDQGTYELQLVCPKLYNFAGKLVSKDKSVPNEVMQEKLLVRMVDNDVIFLVNLPVPGKYYLDLYVASSHASQSMDHACGFMLNCLGPAKHPNLSYPQVGPMGRLPYFEHMGLTEETHVDSHITAHGEFVVAFTASRAVRVTHMLQYYNQRDRSLTDCERYAFPKHRGDSFASFVVKCPKRGLYVLTFSGESLRAGGSERAATVHTVYRYLIDCRTPVQSGHSFPRASKRWQHCKLLTPLSGDLPLNANVTFKIESSVAKGMVVVIDDEWSYLVQQGDVWQGVVGTGRQPGKALVYGRIDAARDKYIPCLEYAIVDMS